MGFRLTLAAAAATAIAAVAIRASFRAQERNHSGAWLEYLKGGAWCKAT